MKILRGERELSEKDVEEIPKGLIPGEWVCLVDITAQKKYLSFVNPHADIFFKIKIIKTKEWAFNSNEVENKIAEENINDLLMTAIKKRTLFSDYSNGSRLVFGINDSLPGLIVDKYKRYILVQINTAGIDRFRDLIRSILQKSFVTHQVLFYDNVEYRKAEILPTFEKIEIDGDLEVEENDLQYKIPKNVLQKIGYYYDHRENRSRLKSLLLKLNVKKDKGLDLFSYVGSWGLHLLSAGVGTVEFVDQGQMQAAIETNLELNKFSGRGQIVRADVFKYLDIALAENKKFDVIVSDPPAFTKSEKNKVAALQGYEKLHMKAMKLLNDQGIMVVASCTHYANYEELDKTVQDAAFRNGQTIQLLDLGGQGFDHPMTGLKDKSFYIKYLVYYVSRG
ncbi:MAG: class I SAM-dependent rRNA methyltransferase [Bacteriovorax sp.]|nr:class I SAM-dependent rRNA methyltransferase [Bacteriovorax sp.]